MRRVIAAGVTGGLILGGSAAVPALAAVPAATSGPAEAARPAMKTVTYAGYAFQVPASWPVYRLDEDPRTCVRYDVHAVYLGTPGANMDCPAGLVGRTQTVSFIPAGSAGPGGGGGSRRPAAGLEPQRLATVHSALSRNPDQHELEVTVGAAGAGGTLLGTYGAAPGVIEQVLGTLRAAPAGAARAVPQRVAVAPVRARAAQATVRRAAAARKIYTSWRGVPADWSAEIVQPPPWPPMPPSPPPPPWSPPPPSQPPPWPQPPPTTPQPPPPPPTPPSPPAPPSPPPVPPPPPPPPPPPQPPVSNPVGGFDTCTAPSLRTMRVWRRAYAAVGAYIGGVNAACAYGNLSASWIRRVAAMGWGVLPTYVGPQAPCWNGGTGVRISPRMAAAQGHAAGRDAVRDARYFGLAPGSPIYYDLEAYVGGSTCKRAILAFLSAWDRSVAASGYLTAVYSSRNSGIANIEEWAAGHHPGFTPPDAIWIALWDGIPSLAGDRLAWPLTERAKQYSGNATVTVGGIRLNIDKDVVGGPVAR